MFIVNLTANAGEGRTRIFFGFKCQADTDDFQWIGKEDSGDARKRSRHKATYRRFLRGRSDEKRPQLLIGNKFNCSIRKDTEEGCRVTSEKTSETILTIDVAHGGHCAEPRTGILGELRVGSLEKDLDTVEGSDDCFGLRRRLTWTSLETIPEVHTAHPANPPHKPDLST